MPRKSRPIVFIGAGGIVRNAHLPAYANAGFETFGAFDVTRATVEALASDFRITRVYRTLAEAADARAAGGRDVVFDVAVPADQILPVLRALPARSVVLIQKPLGRNLAEARRIVALCRSKRLIAAVNFQLRFSPNVLALRDALDRGRLGIVRDVEFRVVTHTPWGLWTFLRTTPRLEVLYHSIHYLDLIRALLGEPARVWCSAMRDPSFRGYADTRSSIALEFSSGARACVHTDHAHTFAKGHKMSQLLVEGSRGAAVAKLGVNLEYPRGEPDTLELCSSRGAWKPVALRGAWFPDAFAGTMSNLQRFAAGEDDQLHTAVADSVRTMALVEACYRSATRGGTTVRSK